MLDERVFEAARTAWSEYCSALTLAIPEDDARRNLSAEVRTRLGQLDLILKNLRHNIHLVTPNPEDQAYAVAWSRANHQAYERGEIPDAVWLANAFAKSMADDDPQGYLEAWDSVTLFTEAFYLFAWRLVDVLNGGGKYRFPELEKISAAGVTLVRNHLIQHPEKRGHGQNFTQSLTVVSTGPVLRGSATIVNGTTGEVLPSDDTVDEGLWVNAEKFRQELHTKIERATAKLRDRVSQSRGPTTAAGTAPASESANGTPRDGRDADDARDPSKPPNAV